MILYYDDGPAWMHVTAFVLIVAIVAAFLVIPCRSDGEYVVIDRRFVTVHAAGGATARRELLLNRSGAWCKWTDWVSVSAEDYDRYQVGDVLTREAFDGLEAR